MTLAWKTYAKMKWAGKWDRCESCGKILRDTDAYYLWADDVKTCESCGGANDEHPLTRSR